jgi:hypothetical protein
MCSKSARNGLREPETRQRHFQCYFLRTLFFGPPGTYTALQDRPSLHPGQPIFIMRHSEITVLCSRSFISVIRLYCNICVINMGISNTNASARTCIPQCPSSFIDTLMLAFSSKTLMESNESLSLVSSPCRRPVSVLLRVTRNKITMAAAPRKKERITVRRALNPELVRQIGVPDARGLIAIEPKTVRTVHSGKCQCPEIQTTTFSQGEKSTYPPYLTFGTVQLYVSLPFATVRFWKMV